MLSENDYALFIENDKILTQKGNHNFMIPIGKMSTAARLNITDDNYFFLGSVDNKNIYVVSLNSETDNINSNLVLMPTRDLLTTVDKHLYKLILSAKQIINWHRASLYCGHCGTPTLISDIETAKICPNCKRHSYPSAAPAIIVLIEHDNKILLARSPHFTKGVYSILAGFIDPGESCEDAIQREVLEEVGITVKNINYFGSQSWPFPNSFMLGFSAQYASGQICSNDKEIEDVQWFSRDKLPNLPSEASIARQMIDHFVAKKN